MWHDLTSEQELLRDTTSRYLADKASLARQRKMRDDPMGFAPDWQEKTAEAALGASSTKGNPVVLPHAALLDALRRAA